MRNALKDRKVKERNSREVRVLLNEGKLQVMEHCTNTVSTAGTLSSLSLMSGKIDLNLAEDGGPRWSERVAVRQRK